MADQERKLDHGLQVMLDILMGYLGNAATRTEWLLEIQKQFTGRDRKLRRGWSSFSIDRKITKLEKMGLITGGRGYGVHYSAVLPAQPRQLASTSELPANENVSDCNSFLDVLEAAKLQLLNRGKSSAA
jgi:hypothetical protein